MARATLEPDAAGCRALEAAVQACAGVAEAAALPPRHRHWAASRLLVAASLHRWLVSRGVPATGLLFAAAGDRAQRAALEALAPAARAVADTLPALPPDRLGVAYQGLLSPGLRKRAGVYFTGEALTVPTVERVLAPLLRRAPGAALRIVDPAVGSGAFLLAALTFLRRRTDAPAAVLVRDGLFGVDLDPTAASLAAWSLWQAAADPELPVAAVEANVRTGDGLLDLPRGAFDAVLGNPPWETMQANRLESHAEQPAAGLAALADWRQLRDEGAARTAELRRHHHHQGRGKLYTYRLFVEQAFHLLRDGGRLGLVVPGALWSDAEAQPLRRLLLDRCRWEWLFGCENRARLFPIDSRYRFGPIVAQKGGRTTAVKCAFQRADVADWASPRPRHLALDRATLAALSPAHGAFVELESPRDLEVLRTMHAHGEAFLAPGGAFRFAQGDFNLTADAGHFVPRSEAERDGYRRTPHGTWRRRGAPELLPLWQGAMIDDLHPNAGAHAGGTGHHTRWQPPRDPRQPEPQFLVAADTFHARGAVPLVRAAFRTLSNATNARTTQASLLPAVPCGNSLGLLTPKTTDGDAVQLGAFAAGVLASLAFDWALRQRLAGTNLNRCVLVETVFPRVAAAQQARIARLAMQLTALLPGHRPAIAAAQAQGWLPTSAGPATGPAARRRLRIRLELEVARAYGLGHADLAWMLRDCDLPAAELCRPARTRQLPPKGFWRLDRALPPAQRLPVQVLRASGVAAGT